MTAEDLRNAAEARMVAAKRIFSDAARAALAGDADAQERAREAFEAVRAARRELAELP